MLLVIGYGNELRRDDGVGPHVARAVAAWGERGVRALAVHQLTPELTEDIAGAEEVVFVDAAAELSFAPVAAAASGALTEHACGPAALLALAEALYGRRPAAWLLTVPARDLDFGEGLSPETEADLARALGHVRRRLSPPRPGSVRR
jgi:hydrogenase maturation protease